MMMMMMKMMMMIMCAHEVSPSYCNFDINTQQQPLLLPLGVDNVADDRSVFPSDKANHAKTPSKTFLIICNFHNCCEDPS